MYKKFESPIQVTQAIAPDEKAYADGLHDMFARHWFTNHGPFLTQLEEKLKQYTCLEQIALTSSGTMALLLATRCAGLNGEEVITTPFTYVGTLSSLLWEDCKPVFCDIDEETLCLNPALLPTLPCHAPKGIMPVHIYGNACEVEQIDSFAAKNSLTVIYDAAQAFGCKYAGKDILALGDFSICSFHSTKVFHTVEGGCVCSKKAADSKQIRLLGSFGHVGDEHYTLGINAKMTEPHALMGLLLLDKVKENIAARKKVSEMYDALLPAAVRKIRLNSKVEYNYSYYPLVFESEKAVLKTMAVLNEYNIFPRRYFFPSLTTLPYVKGANPCPVAESIAPRILCMPLYAELEQNTVSIIMELTTRALRSA